ncbi:MAG: hypothetical protein IJ087_10440 [Eggerthellaceae bacterium]|nr:hypothetical protein [Eggerthellaceae bacterium]
MSSRPSRRNVIVTGIAVIVLVALGVAGGLFLRTYIETLQEPTTAESDRGQVASNETDLNADEREDAVKIFGEGVQVVSRTSVEDSLDVDSEETVSRKLKQHGFGSIAITSEYSLKGEYYKAKEVDEDSSEEHPAYEALYVSGSGDLWNILDYNGQIMAYPVSYNLDSSRGVSLVISEKDSVTSYVSETNEFYEIIPAETQLVVGQVDRVDAAALDALTAEELDRL